MFQLPQNTKTVEPLNKSVNHLQKKQLSVFAEPTSVEQTVHDSGSVFMYFSVTFVQYGI